jgi:uncharacterized RDD family membrane protein YckC
VNSQILQGDSPAGFWLRLVAWIIDLVVLAVPLAVFVSFLSVVTGRSRDFVELRPGIPAGRIVWAFGPAFLAACLCFLMVLAWLYFVLFESSSWQATLGKRFLNLCVADMQGRRISFARASARFLTGRLLVIVPLFGIYYYFMDCLFAGFTPRKQAIHDLLARSLVLRKPRTNQLAE